MKVTAADNAFSTCIKERVNWHCEKCNKEFPQGTTVRGGLDCHHLITRGGWAVRYDPDNAVALCVHDHRVWAEGNPFEVSEWAENKFGIVRINSIRRKAERVEIGKRAHREQREIAAHYRKELAYMQMVRAEGNRERNDFADYFEEVK